MTTNLPIETQQLANLLALKHVAFPELYKARARGLVYFDEFMVEAPCKTYRCAFGQYLISCEHVTSEEDVHRIADMERKCLNLSEFSPRFGIKTDEWNSLFGHSAYGGIEDRERCLDAIIESRTGTAETSIADN